MPKAHSDAGQPNERRSVKLSVVLIPDRTSKRVNDHDAVDGSRTRNATPVGKDAGPADTPACTPPIFAMTGRAPVSTMR